MNGDAMSEVDIRQPEAFARGAQAPLPEETPFIARARRILSGNVCPDDYLVVPAVVDSAVAGEEAQLNASFGVNSCGPYIARIRYDWTLQYFYGTETVACRLSDSGVIVLAVGSEEIRSLLERFPRPEERSKFYIATPPLWQPPDHSASPSLSAQLLPRSA